MSIKLPLPREITHNVGFSVNAIQTGISICKKTNQGINFESY
jgi:hypothetical protein